MAKSGDYKDSPSRFPIQTGIVKSERPTRIEGRPFFTLATVAVFGVGLAAILAWSKRRIDDSLDSVEITEREPEAPPIGRSIKNQRGQYGRR